MATNTIAIANLPAILPAQIQGDDLVPMVDVNDLTDPGGTTKKATVAGLAYPSVPRNGRTVSVLQTYLANNAVFNVRDYGALGNGVDDDTAAFQACATACGAWGSGYVFYMPYTQPGPGGYIISQEIVFPMANGMVILGDGKGSSVVSQITPGIRGFVCDGTTAAGGEVENALFANFRIGSVNNTSPSCTDSFYCKRVNRSSWIQVKADSGTNSGFHIIACNVAYIAGCEAAFCGTSNVTGGWVFETGGITGLNGFSMISCNGESNNGVAVASLNGMAGGCMLGNTFESNKLGGVLLQQGITGMALIGNYFENNTDGSSVTQDLYLGSTSFVSALDIRGNYFNGRPTGQTYDYVPIRLGFIHGCTIDTNWLTTGNRFVQTTSNFPSSTQVHIKNTIFAGTFDNSVPFTTYGITAGFAHNQNTIDDATYTMPQGDNVIQGDMPYAVTTSLGGSSTWLKTTTVSYAGRFGIGNLNKVSTATAEILKVVTLSSTSELLGKIVTFSLPLCNTGVGGNVSFSMEVDFGSGAPTQTVNYGPFAVSDGWQVCSVTCPVSSTETSLTFALAITSANTGLYIGKLVARIGAQLPVDDLYSSGPPYWATNAIPTAGAWIVGDSVVNTMPTVLGSSGSQYVITSWGRLTTGSGNVLNTDWVQCRALTGT